MSQPNPPTPRDTPPFVVVHHEHHLGGAEVDYYLAPGGAGAREGFRWVPFGEARQFHTRKEAEAAKAMVLHFGDEATFTISIRRFEEVLEERRQSRDLSTGEGRLRALDEDFRRGQATNDPNNPMRLALIGMENMARKGRGVNDDFIRLEPSTVSLGDFGL